MTTQIEHTPTPWYASDDLADYSHIFTEAAVEDIFVAMIDTSDAQTQANVTYIVKAANAYPVAEKLAEALANFFDWADGNEHDWGGIPEVPEMQDLRKALEAWNEDE